MVYVFNFDLFAFSAAILEKGLLLSNAVPLPDLYFDLFFYPVALIVTSAGALFNSFIYRLLSKSQTLFGKLRAFSAASCLQVYSSSLIPFTRANAQWVFHGFHLAL